MDLNESQAKDAKTIRRILFGDEDPSLIRGVGHLIKFNLRVEWQMSMKIEPMMPKTMTGIKFLYENPSSNRTRGSGF